MKNELETLLLQFANQLEGLTKQLRDDSITLEDWRREFLKLIALYLALAIGRPLSQVQESEVRGIVLEQETYLNGFAQEYLQKGWQESFLDRARMYAESIREPYWDSVLSCAPDVPRPADGSTLCDGFCKCHLTIEWIDRARCDLDIYWHRTASESCQTCVEREVLWNPLRVRNGEIING